MRRERAWRVGRVLAGVGILALLVGRLGTAPAVAALHALDARVLVAAVLATGFTTLACAWRWQQVAGRFGMRVALPAAVRAYYRSQLLNVTLPGGVLGDVHRGVRHGVAGGSLDGGLRSVAWERALGQLAQGLLVLLAVGLLPSGVRRPVLVAGLALAVLLLAALAPGRARRVLPLDDVRRLLARPRVLAVTLLVSLAAAAAHGVLFVLAAQAVGVGEPAWRLLPLALLVLTVSAVPLNLAGWGPREGAAAWVFSAAGMTASQGLTVSVVYGAMVLVATLPGVLVLASEAVARKGSAHA